MNNQTPHLDDETLLALVQARKDARRDQTLAAHLATCDHCRQVVEQMKQLQAGMKKHYAALYPSEQAWERVAQQIGNDNVLPLHAQKKQQRRMWPWFAGAAASVLFALQLAWIHGTSVHQAHRAGYQPLGAIHGTRLHLWVRFSPHADSLAITQLLQRHGLTIDGGPDAQGRYRLALPADADERQLQATLHDLRQHPLVHEVLLP